MSGVQASVGVGWVMVQVLQGKPKYKPVVAILMMLPHANIHEHSKLHDGAKR